MLVFGCILFALGSAACALAPSTAWLIAARVVQGLAAAVLTPASLALIGSTFPLDERNRAIGVWAATSSLTTAGGPVLGGWLTEAFGRLPQVFARSLRNGGVKLLDPRIALELCVWQTIATGVPSCNRPVCAEAASGSVCSKRPSLPVP